MAALSVVLAGALAVLPEPLDLAEGFDHARAGDWVVYAFSGGAPRRQGFWRIAVVEAARDTLGREAVWVEMELGLDVELRSPLLRARMLVARRLPASGAVTRLFLALGLEPVREVAPEALASLLRAPPARAAVPGAEVRRGAPELVSTPAGSVRAAPVEVRAGGALVQRLSLSRQVPVLGLVRWEVPALAHKLEVRDFGAGARARIPPPDLSAPVLNIVEPRGASQ